MMDAILAVNTGDQTRLIAALRNPAVFGDAVERVTIIETHISYVLLTGRYAYKIKKAIALGFLDYSTLAKRRACCEQELRLNRRLAPGVYLDVVAITGHIAAPAIGGDGPVLEYAVRMREFAQDALLSRVLARRELTAATIDALAAEVASFHARIGVAAPDGAFGTPDEILGEATDNFAQIRELQDDAREREELDALSAWTGREFSVRAEAMRQRRQDGFVRECHGDLHLGNVALVDGAITIFDGIEFSERLRWIDVMSEIAFVVMDLMDRGRRDFAYRFLNGYLEITGDYGGLAVLPFYLSYRAMVRAKVACLRAAQLGPGDARAALVAEHRGYVDLAREFARPPRPGIVVMHGLSGSGKTTLSQSLLERIGAVRVRTDVERKRLHGLAAAARSASGIDHGLYTGEATRETYRRACAATRDAAAGGWVAIVDAAFLLRWQRDLFRQMASELRVPFVIVDLVAGDATLRERIRARYRYGHDASEADIAVLEHQLQTREPLAADEAANVVNYDAEMPLERSTMPDAWRDVIDRLGLGERTPTLASSDAADTVDPGLQVKVAFLESPRSYPEPTTRVDTVETHLSFVFLTDRFAYKLKKPMRLPYLDLRTVGARKRDCDEELRLNRRLTRDVYLDCVSLSRDASGGLRLGADGTPVDWLVRMRRLPADRMLDRLIRDGRVRSEDLRRVVAALARCYREGGAVVIDPADYRRRFADGIEANEQVFSAPKYSLPAALSRPVSARQREVLVQRQGLFDERVRAGRIVDGHGDLRPEHICLEADPQIIDCLAFSRDLRVLDTADELGFLALECERLGAPELAQDLLDAYGNEMGDAPPPALVHFYQSYRACVRAKIALWHLDDPALCQMPQWPEQARDYLRLARLHVAQCP